MDTRRSIGPGIALAAVVVLGACASAGTASTPLPPPSTAPSVVESAAVASASPEPTAEIEWLRHTSERYAYAIDYPADWEIVSKEGEPVIESLLYRSPGTDTIGTAYSHLTDTFDGNVVIAAFEVEAGSTLDDFTDSLGRGACGSGTFGAEETTLDGEPAHAKRCRWGDAYWVQLTALHDGRGYVMWLIGNINSPEPRAHLRPINQQFIESFEFTD